MNVLDFAIRYTRDGSKVVPVPYQQKAPVIKGWQTLYLTEPFLASHFAEGKASNIGVLMGEPSKWLIDIDLDHPLAVAKADAMLPPTPAVFGRASKPRSHRIYRVSGPIATKKFRSRVQGMLVEIRSTGTQTIFPPSVHPSGEQIMWDDADATPAEVDPAALFSAVEKLANTVLDELGERKSKHQEDDDDSGPIGTIDKRLQGCLEAMKRMQVGDEHDGSNRLFAAACRTVEFDLNEQDAVAVIRTYIKQRPFPRGWTEAEILQRVHDAEKQVERGGAAKGPTPRGPSQATALVALCKELALFHDDEVGYVTLKIGERSETLRLRSSAFRSWLSRWFFEREDTVPGGQALADAIVALDGKARFDGPQIKVHVRLAQHQEAIYLDLADADRNIVEITKAGWRVVTDVPVRFRRPRGLLPLPIPTRGGSLVELRQFINFERDSDFILCAAWLVAAFRLGRPLPILIFSSEQGSGKSTTSRLLRLLVDPNEAPIRCQPREPRDLMIAANNSVVVALDNISGVPVWLSDALCRLSTGGGFSTRTLYENDDEFIFNSLRPVMLNGIEDVGTRSDLLDRAIRIALPSIPEDKRQPERTIYAKFESARPGMLGALLDAVSAGMRNVESIELKPAPRMADFAEWVVAAEPALPWRPGEFMSAYRDNRAGAHALAVESEPVGEFIMRFAQQHGAWTGTSTDLLKNLNALVGDNAPKPSDWPKKPQSLTGILKRLAPNLRAMDVMVDFGRTGRRRQVTIRTGRQNSVTSVTERHSLDSDVPDGVSGDACVTPGDDRVTLPDLRNTLDVTLDDAGDALLQRSSNDCRPAGNGVHHVPEREVSEL